MASPVGFVESLPVRSDAGSGDLYRVRSGIAAVDVLSTPAVNVSDMSVRMRISTDAVDRERMVIRQEGIDISLYRANPVVLYGHGEEGIILPVAISEDLAGNCTVTRGTDGTYATAYHKSKDKTSSQMFDAIECGLLRASSVGVTPKEVSVQYDKARQKVPVVDGCYLNEWSYCAVGVNPEAFIVKSHSRRNKHQAKWIEAYALQCEAINRILRKNTLDGSPILPHIKRSLSCLAPKAGAYSVGAEFEERKNMKKSLTRSEVKKLSDLQLAKSITKMMDYDVSTQKMFGEEVEDREDVDMVDETGGDEGEEAASGPEEDKMLDDTGMGEMDDAPAEDAADTSSGQKPGSAAIHKIHSDLQSLVANADAAVAPIENPGVVKDMTKEIQTLRDVLLRIEGIHGKLYPDQPSLAGDEPEVDEDMVKSWLASDTRRQVQLAAIAGRVAGWARRLKSGEITAPQLAKSLSRSSQDLTRINEAAKEHKPLDESFIQRFEALEKGIKGILDQLDKQPA